MNKFLIILLYFSTTFSCFALKEVLPEDSLEHSDISEIERDKNFFLARDIDDVTPVWQFTGRKYSSHFLGNRNYYLSKEEVLEKMLKNSFSIQYSLEQLYRSKWQVHSRIGGVSPSLHLVFGEGGIGLDIGKLFSGLFGFLIPSQWMKIVNQKRVYKISSNLLLITILNDIMSAKIAYINQHQLIQEFEIRTR